MPIKIEKKVPLWPIKHPNRRSDTRYPLADMEPGDSFKVICQDKKKLAKIQSSITARARALRPKKFTTRTKKSMIRCWRLV